MNDILILLATVPPITAFIGYVTNWAAVRMMFQPAEPVGIGPLKWQGIVYRMGEKFASEISKTTSQVLTPADIVERLDLEGLIHRLLEVRADDVDEMVGRALDEVAPGAWASMAPEAKDQLRTMLLTQIGSQMDAAMATLGPRLPEVLDLDALVVENLTGENSERLARIAQEIGGRELRFVEIYGGVLGLIVGLVQVALFDVFGIWWTMPIVGGIVGLGTNWLAIQMIFRPLEPRRFLGLFTYQGMFPKRQREIAADYGAITEREIFTAEKLVAMLVDGPGFELLLTELRALATTQIGAFRPMLGAMAGGVEIGDADVGRLVASVERDALALLPAVRPQVEAHIADSLEIGALIEDRLGSLEKAKFERMLRGIFEEDEWILVVVGGALGAAIGVLQGLLVLGFDL